MLVNLISFMRISALIPHGVLGFWGFGVVIFAKIIVITGDKFCKQKINISL